MNKTAFIFVLSFAISIGLIAGNNPVVMETSKGKAVEVEVVSEGSISLFSQETEILPATIPEDPIASYTQTHTSYFISKGGDQLTEVHCANYKEVLKSEMSDNPELTRNIGKKGYKFHNLERIVELYNQ